jgi:Nuclear transport factor 2 (NTF2) domain
VSGELSNNGQPLRRFMQTFVLAPQSPKKYYVHNDIFRYQVGLLASVAANTLYNEYLTKKAGTRLKPSIIFVSKGKSLSIPIVQGLYYKHIMIINDACHYLELYS